MSLFGAECPVECTHHWHGVIKNIVESRVNKVRPVTHACHVHTVLVAHPAVYRLQLNPENRINLLCAVETCENTPDILINIFTEAAIAGLDMLNEKVSACMLCAWYEDTFIESIAKIRRKEPKKCCLYISVGSL